MSLSQLGLERDVQLLVLRILKPREPIEGELRRSDIGEWDSLKHVEIVFALEDEYGVQFDESEFAAMNSPAAIAALLRPRLEA